MRQLKLGSLFDGIGGWQLAAVHAGVLPVWSSEIEAFPIEVTKRRFPTTKQLGDITKIRGFEIEPVDIICAGSPCQDLSTAGKREGLKGERSGLFAESIRIVREMQQATGGAYPRYFVWENVLGAFSSNKGNDFRAVLQEITQTDILMPKFGRWARAGVVAGKGIQVSWREMDSRDWNVPQRRKRIFLVADFSGQSAGEILFEREGVPGDFEANCKQREATSGGDEISIEPSDRKLANKKSCLLKIRGGKPGGGKGALIQTEVSATLSCNNDQTLFTWTKDENGGEWQSAVRRLLPIEFERLQGLPDNYTLIDHESCTDSARYKALGNGMAQPCADFVIRRIAEVNGVSNDTMGNDNE